MSKLLFLFLTILILFFFSCKPDSKFNQTRWAEHTDFINYSNRKYVIDDLLKNYHLKEKSYSQILDLLGQPAMTPLKTDTVSELLYGIEMNFGNDHTLNYTKTLIIKFNSNMIVQGYQIVEWRK